MRLYTKLGRSLEFAQIFGERNSGTDFLRKIVQNSLKNPLNILGVAKDETAPYGPEIFGYKHWFPDLLKFDDARQTNTIFVVVYRNPYTWIRAMMDRPYALEKSIGGKEIKDLPYIKLTGHIRGSDTTNEFHPVTGERVNIFELRQLKILAFEKIRTKADNILYINLEEFILNYLSLSTMLAATFPSCFELEGKRSPEPPRQLMRECFSPTQFSDTELDIIRQNIDWGIESKLGYSEDSYQLGATA